MGSGVATPKESQLVIILDDDTVITEVLAEGLERDPRFPPHPAIKVTGGGWRPPGNLCTSPNGRRTAAGSENQKMVRGVACNCCSAAFNAGPGCTRKRWLIFSRT